MSDSTSDAEELQAVSVLIPDLLRRILPLAEDMRGDDALHAAVSARGSHSLLAPSDGANSCTDAREQAAEDLCDLVASPSSAQVAVRCMAFQILVEVAGHALSSTQNRVAELCMGTLANITCHKKLAEEAASQEDLKQGVVELLLTATDKACLAEVLRFLLIAAKGPSSSVWLQLVLQHSDPALSRILWMADNTLDNLLLERCLDFLLAAASTQQWVLPKLVAAGIMPILEAVLTAYSEATKANAADGNFWSHNAILNTEEPSDCDSSGSPVPTTKPSGTAVMSCLSLMEVIPAGLANLHVTPCLSQNGLLDHAQQCFQQDPSHCRQFWHLPKAIKGHKCTMGDALQAIGSAALLYNAEDESSVDGLSDIASTLVQLLQMHDFLPSRGLVLGRLVTLLACLDSPLWVPQLAESTAASEAVFVVLADDYGFDAVPEQEETCLGQEAAWAVLAALSRHLGATNAPTTEVLICLANNSHTLTSQASRQLSPQYAPYTISKLLQVVQLCLQNWQPCDNNSPSHLKMIAFERELLQCGLQDSNGAATDRLS